jgi:hypothetical protein
VLAMRRVPVGLRRSCREEQRRRCPASRSSPGCPDGKEVPRCREPRGRPSPCFVPWTSSPSRCKEPRHGEPCQRASGADTSVPRVAAAAGAASLGRRPPSLLQNVATCSDPWSTAIAPGHRRRIDDRERRATHPTASPSRGARGLALHDSRRWGQDRWPPWPDPAGEAMASIRRQEHEANREIFCSGGSGFFA